VKALIVFLDCIILAPIFFISFYLAFLSFLAFFKKPKLIPQKSVARRRFAVLVPAHDEEVVVEKTLSSLTELDYPSDKFDVIVIADNCTDKTAEISKAAGAKVLERFDSKLRGKGYALKWCIEQLASSGVSYDAFVVIDADSVASRNLLIVFDTYLEEGAECIQCSDMIAPQPGVWSPEMTRLAFILHNYVRPLGKMALRCSAGLNGNGMCFSEQLLEKYPWKSFSRVEDLERYLELSLDNIRVLFAPEATVHAIMPTEARDAESQRKRWEMGRFPVIRKYAGRLLSSAIRNRSYMILDALIDLVTPAFVNLFVATSAIFFFHFVALILGTSWLTGLTLMWLIVILLDLFHVLGGLNAAHADRDAYIVLLKLPQYAVWKLKLYFKTWTKGDDKGWVRTARDTNRSDTHA
jgi:cellulose synthase/poly-beta-1,6-N-acetylglucosamine synthase-like glycosyltransferase